LAVGVFTRVGGTSDATGRAAITGMARSGPGDELRSEGESVLETGCAADAVMGFPQSTQNRGLPSFARPQNAQEITR